MKYAVITFTHDGDKIARILALTLNIDLFSKKSDSDFNFKEVSKKVMENYKGIIFIGSTGIAVRAIAPYIKSKDIDPAVLVIDNSCNYVISLLSGHLGGANELTLEVSNILGAQPIITTATDNLGICAPDLIAKNNNLIIDDLKKAKQISSLLIEGKKIGFIDDKGIIQVPNGYTSNLNDICGILYISNRAVINMGLEIRLKPMLKLIRRNIVLGIGCRKNFSSKEMQQTVLNMLIESNIDSRAIKSITTVDVKKDEFAIRELVDYLKCNLDIFTINDIRTIQHKFCGSDFVEKTIGVRAVCEPCVELSGAKIIKNKMKLNGMTLCIGEV
ncbi:cobalt-precorrin 5A hydrolase [Clostridium lacusfryxellense]|uniref:cobalt-precorrin 5A hydrolase n=1 Tax=Clostridium lacusfryxellense TaxID=205328 RepID=UPI001C0B95CA|nr:cobalt-precorrin 5A hydrolase [Clostridium lacusfryxellense]MBU3110895.1 cobalt-precorrin 5A hydrolase [Clostridium lacusfryxellense]